MVEHGNFRQPTKEIMWKHSSFILFSLQIFTRKYCIIVMDTDKIIVLLIILLFINLNCRNKSKEKINLKCWY